MMQELLTTFGDTIGEIALVPGSSAVYQVRVNGDIIWDRKKQGSIPDIKELKQLVRDKIAPGMSLGHSDTKKNTADA